VFITGHSLGGALAILCALEFCRQRLPVAAVVTFGQPRVGDGNFAELYDLTQPTDGIAAGFLDEITFRVVNQNDIVPRTPGCLMGYRHCGQEVFLRPDGSAEFNPTFAEKIIWDAIGLYGAYRRLEDVLIRDHFINQYQERIQGL
jgi:triacylglycerol lipase